MKTFHASLAALAIAIITLLPVCGQAQDALVDVVASGYGVTVREATRNAFRSAVETVVGMSVDATTLVENDELIEDEILTYSAGMIEKSSLIGEPKISENGICCVKIKATVKKGQIAEKLRAISSVKVALDGESLFARMVSAQDNLADADAVIRSVLARHAACIVAEAVPGENGLSPLDINPKTGGVFANVCVRIDMAKYAQFVQEVLGKLGPMATKKMRMACKQDRHEEYRADGRFWFKFPPNETLVVVENFRTGNATCLQLEHNIMSCVLQGLATGSVGFRIELKNRAGMTIAGKTVPVDHRHECAWDTHSYNYTVSIFANILKSSRTRLGLIAPVFGAVGGCVCDPALEITIPGKTAQTFRVFLGRFTAEELKNFRDLEITIGHVKDGTFVEYVP